MKWKLVPVEPTDEMVCKAEEDSPLFYHGDPWYGSETPSEGQINAIYKAMLEVAPQPPKLSDERIFELAESFGEFKYGDAQGCKRIEFSRAIEREILGRLGMTEAIDATIEAEKGGA